MSLTGGGFGRHADAVDQRGFQAFLVNSRPNDFDVMLEIKEKDISALQAIEIARDDPRLISLSRVAGLVCERALSW